LTHRRELVVFAARFTHAGGHLLRRAAGRIGRICGGQPDGSKINGDSTPAMLMEFPPNHGLNDATNFNLVDWMRGTATCPAWRRS